MIWVWKGFQPLNQSQSPWRLASMDTQPIKVGKHSPGCFPEASPWESSQQLKSLLPPLHGNCHQAGQATGSSKGYAFWFAAHNWGEKWFTDSLLAIKHRSQQDIAAGLAPDTAHCPLPVSGCWFSFFANLFYAFSVLLFAFSSLLFRGNTWAWVLSVGKS